MFLHFGTRDQGSHQCCCRSFCLWNLKHMAGKKTVSCRSLYIWTRVGFTFEAAGVRQVSPFPKKEWNLITVKCGQLSSEVKKGSCTHLRFVVILAKHKRKLLNGRAKTEKVAWASHATTLFGLYPLRRLGKPWTQSLDSSLRNHKSLLI